MNALDLVWLVPALPLAGALVMLLAGRRLGSLAGWIGPAMVLGSFGASLAAFFALRGQPHGETSHVVQLYRWAASGNLQIDVAFRWDPLSAVMCLVVTGVGFLIHVYSRGYMHGDPRYARFFAYLNLFVFSMLLLVLGDNLLILFAGWELVGLCSYLLIGFWFERPAAATAAKKAFITTRIGDVGFFIGIFLLFAVVGSLDISAILRAVGAGELSSATVTAAALLLFAGAVGKSAQLPLYVWLPDAMEGPTPVSALIHAATMVTAGVYLVVRMNPLFAAGTPQADVVAIVGVVTAIYAAVLAMAEPDIKRVLAYSTVSQLGFMFLAAGLGAYSIAIFHLVTHAFFKALLFLAAGSVMHGLSDETALDRMGGLRKAMPWTFLVTAIGWAAISGVLPFAGFFSKDAILAVALGSGRTGLFVTAVIAASFTAFYMTRLLVLTFFGAPRWSEGTHPHESPAVMIAPMAVLAGLSIVGGALNLPKAFPGAEWLVHLLAPVASEEGIPHAEGMALTALVWGVATAGALVAWWVYGSDLERRVVVRRRLGPLNTLVRNRFFVDEIYATIIVAPSRLVAAFFAYVLDLRVIDGAVNGVAVAVTRAAESWRHLQTGLVRTYALAIFAGAAGVLVFLALRLAP